ncbi:hypothetical protein ACVIHF_008401 [Bradyrhizobium sp. USDA 4506]
MRDANAQRVSTMIPIDGLQQLSRSHVSHAETGGSTDIPIKQPDKGGLITTASAAPC